MPRHDKAPAMQDIPICTMGGRRLRDALRSELFNFDYAEIERRVAQSISRQYWAHDDVSPA